MSDKRFDLESHTGTHLVITSGKLERDVEQYRTQVYLGNIPQNENLVAVEISTNLLITNAFDTHKSLVEHVTKYPYRYTKERFNRLLQDVRDSYVRVVERIRKGFISEESRARYWADKYGFQVDTLEEALEEER